MLSEFHILLIVWSLITCPFPHNHNKKCLECISKMFLSFCLLLTGKSVLMKVAFPMGMLVVFWRKHDKTVSDISLLAQLAWFSINYIKVDSFSEGVFVCTKTHSLCANIGAVPSWCVINMGSIPKSEFNTHTHTHTLWCLI